MTSDGSAARLSPFRAVRYAPAAGDPGDLLAPPFDVIDPAGARDLRDRSPFNAVRLVLPEGEAPGCYDLAARRLRDWLADGLLVRDGDPAFWIYAQSFRHEGRRLTRHGVFGALRLSPFAEGDVLPHEHTHSGPKEDRLALMRACRAQLSPVFLVAPDPADRLSAAVARATEGAPALEARTPDGVRHRLWRVLGGPLAEEIAGAAGARPLLIADGHHRYETALELGRGAPPDHPARRTLACVVSASDPGLLCLPTHRALSRPPAGGDTTPAEAAAPESGHGRGWRAFLEEAFEVREAEVDGPSRAARAAEDAREMAAVLPPSPGRALLLRPRPGAPGGAGDREGAGRPVDGAPAPAVFDRLVLRRGYGIGPDPAVERGLLSYHRNPADALRAAGERGAAVLLPPPDVEAVRESAGRGRRLPPKSTYFWPKLPSGLLFRLLA